MSNEYGVFRDANRHTCIRVNIGRKYVEFIPMHPTEVAVQRMDEKEFSHTYEPMPDYPVKRAAEHYLFTEKFKTFSAKASEHLKRIVADPAYKYDAQQFKPLKKEPEMATKTKATATQAEKISGGKAAANKPAAKGAPAKTKPETVKPTKTKATAAAPATEATAHRGRTSAVSGKKIVLVKGAANATRAGSKRAALLDAVLAAKLTDDVIGQTIGFGEEGGTAVVTPGDVNLAVSLGLITLA